MALHILLLMVVSLAIALVCSYFKRQTRFSDRKYLFSLIQLAAIIFCLIQLLRGINPGLELRSILLNSSALIVAILGFAAQPVIMNFICGLLISFQKPFEIGDRIVVEGHEAGIVEDITLRHTVLRIYDGLRIIIPNGELNSKSLTNLSYHMKDRRGIHLSFSVSYDTEVEKAIEVIRDCVAASPYTLSVENDGVREDSGPVHFLEMGDSALILRTTIWVGMETNTQKAVTDVNLRVLNAFRKYGIEIPYPYFNVVEYQGQKETPTQEMAARPYGASALRHRRSETVHMQPGEERVADAVETARTFAERPNLNPHASLQIELLTEETVDLLQRLMGHTQRSFWVEGTRKSYRIHMRADVHLGTAEEYKKLLELSSTGRNEATNNINKKIVEALLLGQQKLLKRKSDKERFEWQLSDAEFAEDEIGRSILSNVANGVRISITEGRVELIVLKNLD